VQNTTPTTSIVANRRQPIKETISRYPLSFAAATGALAQDLAEEQAIERPIPTWARRTIGPLAVALMVVCSTGLAMTDAQAQYRYQMPGAGYYRPAAPAYRPMPSYRPGPGMIMPAIRGASQLGWYGGSYWAQRQYGPSANPGPWPGLGPALGFRRW
jgi:hypothetical protein